LQALSHFKEATREKKNAVNMPFCKRIGGYADSAYGTGG
jgi:hypothetical protein